MPTRHKLNLHPNIFYSKNALLSRQSIFNYCLGGRGIGKTYSFKEWCINDFIRHGKEFVWVRRYKEELSKDKLEEFVSDIANKFPSFKIEIKAKKMFINDKKAGYFIALSNANFYKSVPMPNVNKLIFDEVILEKGVTKYLPGEMFQLLNLISTITRYRPETLPISDDVRVFCLANRVSTVNPHFDFWKLNIDSNPGIYTQNGITVEICDSEAYKQKYSQTRHGKLLKNTAFYDYAINNNPYMDNSEFIKNEHLKDFNFMYALSYNGTNIGVWQSKKDFHLFFCNSVPNTKNIFVVKQEDHTPNTLWLKSFKKMDYIKQLINAYSVGLISYQDAKIMRYMNEIFSIIC